MVIKGKIITISKKELTDFIRQDRKETIQLARKQITSGEVDDMSVIKRPIDAIKKQGFVSRIFS